jgi:cellulose synthase/poly-beta-1,6-N-acetylglucosamine synthase-like glycosyltransferase
MGNLTILLLVALAIPAALSCCYLMALTVLSVKPKAVSPAASTRRFAVIVPAHNEAGIIARTIASLQRIEWPHDRFRIVVVADNCSDGTADAARAMGVQVLTRDDLSQRGKGYALEYAFSASLADGWADAVVVIDADTDVSANILVEMAARLDAGCHAVQARYGVRNPMASWRTRLITIGIASFMQLRSRGREHLGLSCGIRGNGWCVTRSLLEQVPYRAFSLAEDVEYGIAIGVAGHRVAYADEAYAKSDMVASERIARSQRQRWEDGRLQLIGTHAWPLLVRALRQRSALCLDLGLDLLLLPLSYVVLNVVALTVLSAFALALQWAPVSFLWIPVSCWVILAVHIGRGWQLSGVGVRGLLDLARAPWFLIWKVCLTLSPRSRKGWTRTGREVG